MNSGPYRWLCWISIRIEILPKTDKNNKCHSKRIWHNIQMGVHSRTPTCLHEHFKIELFVLPYSSQQNSSHCFRNATIEMENFVSSVLYLRCPNARNIQKSVVQESCDKRIIEVTLSLTCIENTLHIHSMRSQRKNVIFPAHFLINPICWNMSENSKDSVTSHQLDIPASNCHQSQRLNSRFFFLFMRCRHYLVFMYCVHLSSNLNISSHTRSTMHSLGVHNKYKIV